MAVATASMISNVEKSGYNALVVTFRNDPVTTKVKISRENSGILKCMTCKKEWCSHIEALIQEAKDIELLFAEDSAIRGAAIDVPMVVISENKVLYAELRSWSMTDGGAIAFRLVDRNLPLINGLLDLQFLGYIHPGEGEGRAILRSMIYDWFRANVDTTALMCDVSAHNFDSHQKMQANLLSGGRKAFAEAFSLWRLGQCLDCGAGMESFDDLVPF